jgi:hypothetical protein
LEKSTFFSKSPPNFALFWLSVPAMVFHTEETIEKFAEGTDMVKVIDDDHTGNIQITTANQTFLNQTVRQTNGQLETLLVFTLLGYLHQVLTQILGCLIIHTEGGHSSFSRVPPGPW